MPASPDVESLVRELRRLDGAATAGPWFVGGADDEHCMGAAFVSSTASTEEFDSGWPKDRSDVIAVTFHENPALAASPKAWENTELIVAMRNGLPTLCNSLDSALRRNDALRARLAELVERVEAGATLPQEAREAIARARAELDVG